METIGHHTNEKSIPVQLVCRAPYRLGDFGDVLVIFNLQLLTSVHSHPYWDENVGGPS